ncbi:hypothetical protein GCM10027217_34550 [Pseudomaricurvus hydrocarbonicus]
MLRLPVVDKVICKLSWGSGGNGGLAVFDKTNSTVRHMEKSKREVSQLSSLVAISDPPNPPNPPLKGIARDGDSSQFEPNPPNPPIYRNVGNTDRICLIKNWPTQLCIQDFYVYGLELLRDDIGHLRKYLPSESGRRLEALGCYINHWLVAMDSESEEHKKQNVGRRAANLWLLKFFGTV